MVLKLRWDFLLLDIDLALVLSVDAGLFIEFGLRSICTEFKRWDLDLLLGAAKICFGWDALGNLDLFMG